ncbi:hypothetical protein ABEB36_004132 [Hypothenemus hampei]|uniref:tetrahydrofolate synthase n=1 Tax=Hypothenemus hampei TaxID=57062 RepID=A0ABD1F2A3_HYPHA
MNLTRSMVMLDQLILGVRSSIRRGFIIAQPQVMSNKYREAINCLNNLQSNEEYIKHAKIKNNQENNLSEMTKFLQRSGLFLEQLDTLPIIHVTGTNGKGSTCLYCEQILRSHGFKTGFYSSPHLFEVRERIRINGRPISQQLFTQYFWKIYNQLEQQKDSSYDMPLYFRFLTILAFHVFIQEKVDVAILEVGIGGEYDCTNVVRKTEVVAITPLDIDHTSLLGNTLESIAWNKAGIMKNGADAFTIPQPDVVMNVFKQRNIERKCNLHVIEGTKFNGRSTRIPEHIQKTNVSLAMAISESFMKKWYSKNNNNNTNLIAKSFDGNLAKRSIENARWPGRYEIIPKLNCMLYLDGAHTVDSMTVCVNWFISKTQLEQGSQKVLIFNVIGERSAEQLLKLLMICKFDSVIFVPNVGDDSENNPGRIKFLNTLYSFVVSHEHIRLQINLCSLL